MTRYHIKLFMALVFCCLLTSTVSAFQITEIYEQVGHAPRSPAHPSSLKFKISGPEQLLSILPPYRMGPDIDRPNIEPWPYYHGVIGFDSLDKTEFKMDMIIEEFRIYDPNSRLEYPIRYWIDDRRGESYTPEDSEFKELRRQAPNKRLKVGYKVGVQYRFDAPGRQTDKLILRFRLRFQEGNEPHIIIEDTVEFYYRTYPPQHN